MLYRFHVCLNGTNENPFHRYGLKCNPFPQVAKYELMPLNRLLNNLGAEPIKDETDLRRRLEGASQEFSDGCVARFRPGEMVEFEITFPSQN